MPCDRNKYPDNWEEISYQIKSKANWTCENCGKPCRPPGIDSDDTAEWLAENHPEWFPKLFQVIEDDEHGFIEIEKPQRFALTTAHLNHIESDCRPENLRAWCAPCHLNYDAPHHAQIRYRKKREKQEKLGQLSLF